MLGVRGAWQAMNYEWRLEKFHSRHPLTLTAPASGRHLSRVGKVLYYNLGPPSGPLDSCLDSFFDRDFRRPAGARCQTNVNFVFKWVPYAHRQSEYLSNYSQSSPCQDGTNDVCDPTFPSLSLVGMKMDLYRPRVELEGRLKMHAQVRRNHLQSAVTSLGRKWNQRLPNGRPLPPAFSRPLSLEQVESCNRIITAHQQLSVSFQYVCCFRSYRIGVNANKYRQACIVRGTSSQ